MIQDDIEHQSPRYRWYVLAVLTGVSTFAFIDRQLIVIMQESIKAEMGLSDTQLGLLSGLAFAFFHATFGLVIARLADQYNRKNIITAALTLWSLITAFTGYANNFIQLLFARMGVGIGEAGSSPPAHSMIADYFPPQERGKAYAIHTMGIYFGLLFGFLLGGLLESTWGWRSAFFIIGFPGILFAALLYFTIKEPQRGRFDDSQATEKVPSIQQVLKILLAKKTFIYLGIGSTLHAFVGAAFANWMPPFLARVHNMGTMEIGLWLAFAIGICGSIGTFLGGYLGDKLAKKDQRWYLWLSSIAVLLSFPFALGVLFSENKTVALLFYLMPNVLYAIFMGPSYAVVQGMVSSNMRAITSAVFLLLINMLGNGFGPLSVGMISDWLTPQYGSEAIRWALCSVAFLEIIAVACFYKAATYLLEDMK